MKAFFSWLNREIHLYTWIVTFALDLIWNIFDLSIVGIFILAPIIFGLCFITVTAIQRSISGDEWQDALVKGAIFGFLAAFPFSIVTFLVAGAGAVYQALTGQDDTRSFGQFGLNYREIEKTLRYTALSNGLNNGSHGDASMEIIINFLERIGRLSPQEAHELHRLRMARNVAQHKYTPGNLLQWVTSSQRLLEKYRERFGTYR